MTLYSEDQLTGVSLDLAVVLPFFMDANTSCRMKDNHAKWASGACLVLTRFSWMTTLSNVYDRPFNRRASALLGRPKTSTHGPVLVMKMMLLKYGET